MQVIYLIGSSTHIQEKINKKIKWVEEQRLTPGDGTDPVGRVIDIKFGPANLNEDLDDYIQILILWDYKYFCG